MSESTLPLLAGFGPLILGVAILIALAILPESVKRGKFDVACTILVIGGWSAMVIGGLVLLGTAATIVPPIFGLVVLAVVFQRRRQAGQQALLWTLTAAVGRGLPLTAAIEAFAEDGGGIMGARARSAIYLLRAGSPLPDALAQVGGLVSPRALLLVRMGYETDMLAPALRLAAEQGRSQDAFWGMAAGRIAYFVALLNFTLGILVFMMTKIAPAYSKIFRDFNTDLPPLTQAVLETSYNWAYVPILLLAVLFPLMIYALLRYVGWVHFDVPGLGWLTRRLDGAAVLDALSLTTRRQHPLPEALAALARHYPKAAIRTRLRRVLKDMERGADWIESLRRRGVIGRAETAVLGAAQRVGNLPWALAEMADSSRRRLGYRLHGLMQLLFPAVVLSFGLLVLFIVVGFFMPLVLLIEKLGRW